jgi:4-amino-4-deoxy-L-arabinose transferase-like glycosyltransferase
VGTVAHAVADVGSGLGRLRVRTSTGRRMGGLLCLSAYVSTPAFLAFGPLVHTDVAVTLFSLLALWTFAEVWCEPNRKRLCFSG